MATTSVSIRSNLGQILSALTDPVKLRRVEVRTIARANRDIQRLFIRHLRHQIERTTRTRNGDLIRGIKTKSRRTGRKLSILPNFTRTFYVTPPSRGRQGASKIGQWAFVVNHDTSRRFIQKAAYATLTDRELVRIIEKHFVIVLKDTFPFIRDTAT